jgi:hypothetical protein
MSHPPQPFMTYGMLKNWLEQNGIPESRIRAMLRNGLIKPRRFGGKRNYYNGDQIERDVLNGSGGAR